ncbi:helix-turn-helix domain-containing protein [Chryseobacterium terrae]|uniref:AraC family transcriptional regulator n=1 Tax=Chryseobacterium terrae TaxID=3163299 RepID=A0ABW8Y2U2_9FLAO
MININNEDVFLERTKSGDSFRSIQFAYIIIIKGSLSLEYYNIQHIFTRGNLIMISPENVYKILDYTTDLECTIIGIDRETLRNKVQFNFSRYQVYRLSTVDKDYSLLTFQEEELEIVLHLARQILAFSKKPSDWPFREEIILNIFVSLIYIIMTQILQNTDKIITDVNKRKEEITMKFLQLISDNYVHHKELKFYADNLSISIKYLSNCVREITGQPPTRFISDSIVNEAKSLLLNSRKTVSIIADELGFSDQYSFGKFFKKHTGFSPRNFKNKNKLIETF